MLFKILIKSTRNENTILESMFSKQKYNPIFLKMSSTVTIIFHRKLQSCFVFVFVFFYQLLFIFSLPRRQTRCAGLKKQIKYTRWFSDAQKFTVNKEQCCIKVMKNEEFT